MAQRGKYQKAHGLQQKLFNGYQMYVVMCANLQALNTSVYGPSVEYKDAILRIPNDTIL